MLIKYYIQTLYNHIPVTTNKSIPKLPETVIVNVLSSAGLIESVMIAVVCCYLPNLHITHSSLQYSRCPR